MRAGIIGVVHSSLTGAPWFPRLSGGAHSDHRGGYAQTTKCLPAIPGRITIDAQHTVLQFLSLTVLIPNVTACIATR
jgi:hypothetical protein